MHLGESAMTRFAHQWNTITYQLHSKKYSTTSIPVLKFKSLLETTGPTGSESQKVCCRVIRVPHYCSISVLIHWCIHWRNHLWIHLDTYGDRILHLTLAHGCSLPTMRLLSRKVFQTHRRCSTYLLHGAIGQTCRSDSTNVALSGWWNGAAVWCRSSRDYTSNPNKFLQSKKMLRLLIWGKHRLRNEK